MRALHVMTWQHRAPTVLNRAEPVCRYSKFSASRSSWIGCLFTCVAVAAGVVISLAAAAQPSAGPSTRSSDSVPDALRDATLMARSPQADSEPIQFTIMLNWADAAGFESLRRAFENPASPAYHRLIDPRELTARFGPTQPAYDTVLDYFRQHGFSLIQASANRLTLTLQGTRGQAEQVFDIKINDYQLGSRQFHCNDGDPAIPGSLKPLIRSVSGLCNLAVPRPGGGPSPLNPASYSAAYHGVTTPAGNLATSPGGLPPGLDGTGQWIGLIEFDSFNPSDVSAWLSNAGLPQNMINQVHTVSLFGGTSPSGGNGTQEVLADIAAALGMAPGANIEVFIAPNGTDYFTATAVAFANFINAGLSGVLSTSWSECEREVSGPDIQAMDAMLQSAMLNGLTLFSASGDYGSTCFNNGDNNAYPGRVNYPSDVPSAVAVGGTTLKVGPGNAWLSESWWTNGNDGTSGNGGFGFSWARSRPSYQAPFTSASGRSVPDVVADAGDGVIICLGGICCPAGVCSVITGTSVAAPLWAGIWALVNQGYADAHFGDGVPAGGGTLYAARAFHSMTGVGNDFTHIGLGSPDITVLASNIVGPSTVTSVSPATGSAAGGTTVTIGGSGFIGVTEVDFGSYAAPSFQVLSDSQIVVVTPPDPQYSPLEAPVSVVTPAARGSAQTSTFSYIPTPLPVPQCGGSTGCDGSADIVCDNMTAGFELQILTANGAWVTVSISSAPSYIDAQMTTKQSGTYRVCAFNTFDPNYTTCTPSFSLSAGGPNTCTKANPPDHPFVGCGGNSGRPCKNYPHSLGN